MIIAAISLAVSTLGVQAASWDGSDYLEREGYIGLTQSVEKDGMRLFISAAGERAVERAYWDRDNGRARLEPDPLGGIGVGDANSPGGDNMAGDERLRFLFFSERPIDTFEIAWNGDHKPFVGATEISVVSSLIDGVWRTLYTAGVAEGRGYAHTVTASIAPVPLPAGAALLVGALAVLGFAGKRRRA